MGRTALSHNRTLDTLRIHEIHDMSEEMEGTVEEFGSDCQERCRRMNQRLSLMLLRFSDYSMGMPSSSDSRFAHLQFCMTAASPLQENDNGHQNGKEALMAAYVGIGERTTGVLRRGRCLLLQDHELEHRIRTWECNPKVDGSATYSSLSSWICAVVLICPYK